MNKEVIKETATVPVVVKEEKETAPAMPPAASSAPATTKARKKVKAIKMAKTASPGDAPLFGLAEDLFSALLAAGAPMSVSRINELFADKYQTDGIRVALRELEKKYAHGPLVLKKTASGYRFHTEGAYAARVRRMAEDTPPRYSAAMMETLAIIAYKQPVTKAEIEELRGVTLSGNIMRSLQEHEWIKIIGHKQVPGRPAVWGTTKIFLDSFNLKNLSQLPPLPDANRADTQKKKD